MKRYSINPHAVLFHQTLDAANEYRIYVYDEETDLVRRTNASGYWILRTLDELKIADVETIAARVTPPRSTQDVEKFLASLVRDHVVFEKD